MHTPIIDRLAGVGEEKTAVTDSNTFNFRAKINKNKDRSNFVTAKPLIDAATWTNHILS